VANITYIAVGRSFDNKISCVLKALTGAASTRAKAKLTVNTV
jgi:hypothetical protein